MTENKLELPITIITGSRKLRKYFWKNMNKRDTKKVGWLEIMGMFIWSWKWLLLLIIRGAVASVVGLFKTWFWYF